MLTARSDHGRGDDKVGLPAEKRGNLQNVRDFGDFGNVRYLDVRR